MKRNHISYRFTAIFFALWITLVSAGFVVDLHYCQNELKNFALYTEAESCHNQEGGCKMHNKSCTMDDEIHCNSNDEDNCCHNEKKIIKSSVKYTFDKPAIAKALDFAAVDNNYNNQHISLLPTKSLKPIYVDRPPPLEIDFQALYQSYIL
jgi:hypothetical protein